MKIACTKIYVEVSQESCLIEFFLPMFFYMKLMNVY